ncbi:MAG: MBL fold metallo-hydrolase [Cyclobacteriaceae bacterium]|nr:MBL fold metallo-hydrolase [Cyclobacteriaceae bacterium]
MKTQYQKDKFYRFNIGQFECLSLSDGTFDYDPNHLFLGKSKEEVREIMFNHNIAGDFIKSPYTFPFVNTGVNKVLVDMGAGKLGPDTGKMIDNLKLAGVQPEDIDFVIITHAHPDHIGGTLDEDGNPNYPNARYYIWKKEWDFWFSDEAIQEVDKYLSQIVPTEMFMKVARGQLGPVKDKVEFITEEKEILPGIFTHFAPGHTPGHMVVSFESEGEELYFTSDTVIFPLFLEQPELHISIDIMPEDADISKYRIYDLVADKKALVLAQHFHPFPSLGYIEKKEHGWSWKPISV